MSRFKLLEIGRQERWLCLDCGSVKAKAQYARPDGHFHSPRCQTPLMRVVVTVEPVKS